MGTAAVAAWMLEQEARALLTRLEGVKPFALHETMVPAAALSPAAQTAIERFLLDGRRSLGAQVRRYLAWLTGEGRSAPTSDQQRRFTIIRLQFNNVLSQFDLFTEVVTQRSEHETGVWLSGLDALAADGLRLADRHYEAPPAVCYLARGPGAAIRRARTRLPGGVSNPVAIIRVPRERMVGHAVGGSLLHEVGHQGAALLSLVESLRPVLQHRRASAPPAEDEAWRRWDREVSEVVADLWSVGRLGIGSTLGLVGVVSLPRWFVFRPPGDDPHPMPYLRVVLSAAMGQALYPHPQWAALIRVWRLMYPTAGLPEDRQQALACQEATIPAFVELLVGHRPAALRGHSLGEVLASETRRPDRLLALSGDWRRNPTAMATAPPALAVAVLGQSRAAGLMSPEAENRVLRGLLTQWALRSTLDVSAICAERSSTVTLAGRRAS